DDDFQRGRVIGMHYLPLPRRVFLGVRGEGAAAFGDTPFYLRPFVYMRGVPAMRYQGDEMLQLETEVRWQFWKRISAVAFAGGGKTWVAGGGRDRSDLVSAGGLGFRYELARAYGIHAGADFAYGPAGYAFYIQIGSAWAKP
ncbi:MAG TPA: glyceraldehyde-3-phosphate dehydrogenase, partial [Candidatus Krumholzibacteria bacterium]|nr:glyceraldehyde-3-phosphate dehydrogenase [Candidatus Krumholzibacteria bacterium]